MTAQASASSRVLDQYIHLAQCGPVLRRRHPESDVMAGR
jgi:hypothetical protein